MHSEMLLIILSVLHVFMVVFDCMWRTSPTVFLLFFFQTPARWSKEFNHFLAQALQTQPDRRASAEQLLLVRKAAINI